MRRGWCSLRRSSSWSASACPARSGCASRWHSCLWRGRPRCRPSCPAHHRSIRSERLQQQSALAACRPGAYKHLPVVAARRCELLHCPLPRLLRRDLQRVRLLLRVAHARDSLAVLLGQPTDILLTTPAASGGQAHSRQRDRPPCQGRPRNAAPRGVRKARRTSEKQPSTHLLPEPAPFFPMKKLSTHQSCSEVFVKSLRHAYAGCGSVARSYACASRER
eukprot:COSAG01_NODE_23764_length_802_cov_1.546230_1_plen_220_part_00